MNNIIENQNKKFDHDNNTPGVIKIAMLISMGSFLIAMILLITLIDTYI